MQTKYIFVTGGVMSGLGKGVVTSSIAKLLQLSNEKVSIVKIDPYLNYDAGTMNPIAHDSACHKNVLCLHIQEMSFLFLFVYHEF